MTDVPATILRPSAPRAALHILGCIAFVAAGLFMLTADGNFGSRAAGAVTVIFFGAGGVVLVRRRLRSRPELVIDDQGLTHVVFGHVRWDEVAGVAVRSVVVQHIRQWFVEVLLHDPDAHLSRQSASMRAVIHANRMLGLSPFVIATVALAEKPADVVAAMLRHHPGLIVAGTEPDDVD